MKIIVDMQGIQSASKSRGIGRCSLGFVKALLKNSGGHDIYIVLNNAFSDTIEQIRFQFDGLISGERIIVYSGLTSVSEGDPSNFPRARAAEILREAYFQSLSPDFILVTSLFEGWLDDATVSIHAFDKTTPTGVVHYDIIPYLNPEQYLANDYQKKWYYQKIDYLKKAEQLYSISEFSKEELCNNINILPEKVKVMRIDTSADIINKSCLNHSDTLSKLLIHKKYILHVGVTSCADPRKNIKNLIHAYSLLEEKLRINHQLVLVGQISALDEQKLKLFTKDLGLCEDSIVFTDYLSDEELGVVYKQAEFLIIASTHEGFGLPVIEAMHYGIPAIGSNCSSIPEVIGCKEGLFDPYDPYSISAKMAELLVSDALRSKLLKVAGGQVKKFCWNITAQNVIKNIEENVEKIKSKLKGKSLDPLHEISKIQGLTSQDLLDISQAFTENTSFKQPKQLFVDVSELAHRNANTGIQRVVHHIVKHLLSKKIINGYEVQPVYRSEGNYVYASKFKLKYQGVNTEIDQSEVIDVSPSDIFLGLDLDAMEDREAQSLLQHHAQRGMRIYYVVYDLLAVRHPEWFLDWVSPLLTNWFKKITNMADGLFCISKAVEDDLIDWCQNNVPSRFSSFRISHFHLGSDFGSGPNKLGNEIEPNKISTDDMDLIRTLQGKESLLMVGTVECRKGHQQVLDAFEELWSQNVDICLIIAGGVGWNVESLLERVENHSELNKRLFWFNKPEDNVLALLYKNATAFLMASLGEGFGLPLIEAAYCKKPIIARDLPVFKEIAGEHAYYFSGTDGATLANELQQWLQLYYNGTFPKSDGLSTYSWSESAEALLKLIFKSPTTDCKEIYKVEENKLVQAQSVCPATDAINAAQNYIYIDVSHISQKDHNSGIQRVVKNIVYELYRNSFSELIPVAVELRGGELYEASEWLRSHGLPLNQVLDPNTHISFKLGDQLLMLDSSWANFSDFKHVFEKARNVNVPISSIVYDLLPIRMPECWPKGSMGWFEEWVNKSLRESDSIICISESVADDLKNYIASHKIKDIPRRISYWHLGSNFSENTTVLSPASHDSGFDGPYLLMVGTLEPRKSHALALDSFEELWNQGVKLSLCIVGKKGWQADELLSRIQNHRELGKRLFYFESVSDEILAGLYQQAAGTLQLSKGEGFGLPLIEAAEHGIPILCSDIPVFREIAGEYASYLNILNQSELIDQIKEWLQLREKNELPDTLQMPRLTWQESAATLLDVILNQK